METPIASKIRIVCKVCDTTVEVDVLNKSFGISFTCPHCKLRHSIFGRNTMRPTAASLLHAMGIEITLDWDQQLIVNHVDPLPPGVEDWITRNQVGFRHSIKSDAQEAASIFVGGPHNGEKHHRCASLGGSQQRIGIRMARAHWAVYEFRDRDDPRCYFTGYASSEAKAKRGELKPKAE